MSDAREAESESLVYAYRPRLVGAAFGFRLGSHSLEWDLGGRRGSVAYPMIARVRLSYLPSNLGARRFVTKIWPRNAPRVELASSSYKSVVLMEEQGPAYNAFVRELHRRIVDARGDCRFDGGFAAWRWWPMAAVGVGGTLGLAYFALQTLASGDWSGMLLVAAFTALFVWQVGPLVTRNRPRSYDPRQIPEDLLPPDKKAA